MLAYIELILFMAIIASITAVIYFVPCGALGGVDFEAECRGCRKSLPLMNIVKLLGKRGGAEPARLRTG